MSDRADNTAYTFDEDLREVPVSRTGMEKAVAALDRKLRSGALGERAQLEALGEIGALCRILGRLDEARSYLKRALELARRLGAARSEVANLIRLAHVRQWQGDFDATDGVYLGVIERCEIDPELAGYLDFACQHYGKSLFDQGRCEEAAEQFRRALDIRQQRGDHKLTESSRQAWEAASRQIER